MLRNLVRRSLLATLGENLELPSARRRMSELSGCLSREDRDLLKRVRLSLHSRDAMYKPFHPDHYLGVGLSAIHCIDAALAAASPTPVIRSILDFPCGHGRVMRFLRAKFPDAAIYGAELDATAVEFCRREFDAKPVPTAPDFDQLNFDSKYDLIWCGSLITHIPEASTASLLRFFYRHLNPNGICVFTTHGRYSVELLESGATTYGLTAESCKSIVADYRATSYGYAEYPTLPGYGISLSTTEKIQELSEGKNVLFAERGWDDHQDVHAYQR